MKALELQTFHKHSYQLKVIPMNSVQNHTSIDSFVMLYLFRLWHGHHAVIWTKEICPRSADVFSGGLFVGGQLKKNRSRDLAVI